jgi:hypothetical protein
MIDKTAKRFKITFCSQLLGIVFSIFIIATFIVETNLQDLDNLFMWP